jgi:hypothetical protein
MIDFAKATKFVDRCWDNSVVPTLVEYIRVPNRSPFFDPDWTTHGGVDPERVLKALGAAVPREFDTAPTRLPPQAIVLEARRRNKPRTREALQKPAAMIVVQCLAGWIGTYG